MTVWTVGTAIQFLCVLANGGMLLLNFSRYRRHHAKIFLVGAACNILFLSYSGVWMIFDAGKVSGNW